MALGSRRGRPRCRSRSSSRSDSGQTPVAVGQRSWAPAFAGERSGYGPPPPARAAHTLSVKRLILLGRVLPLVRRDGIWTGCFFFHSAHVIGPSGVSMMVSSMPVSIALRLFGADIPDVGNLHGGAF